MELKDFFQNVIELVRRYGNPSEFTPEVYMKIFDDSTNAEWDLTLCSIANRIVVYVIDQSSNASSVFAYKPLWRSKKIHPNKVRNIDLFLRFQRLIKEKIENKEFSIE